MQILLKSLLVAGFAAVSFAAVSNVNDVSAGRFITTRILTRLGYKSWKIRKGDCAHMA